MYRIKNLLWRVKNTWSWAKFIWGLRGHYDYSVTYKILRFSLSKSVENFESSNIKYFGIDHDVYYMRLCIKLIDRIETEYYDERAHEELEKRWGKYVTTTQKVNDGITVYKMTVKRELDITEADSKRYKDDFIKTYNFWMNKHTKAKKLLHRILEEKLENWWI